VLYLTLDLMTFCVDDEYTATLRFQEIEYNLRKREPLTSNYIQVYYTEVFNNIREKPYENRCLGTFDAARYLASHQLFADLRVCEVR
jgi:hypothetical protein